MPHPRNVAEVVPGASQLLQQVLAQSVNSNTPQKSIPVVTAARLQCYALFLAGYDYKIEYKNANKCIAKQVAFRRETQKDPVLSQVHEMSGLSMA